jgi:hypothetical protein
MSTDPRRTASNSTNFGDQSSQRAAAQDSQDPSGHNMQVTPRQQRQVADAADRPAGGDDAAAIVDEETLVDLKNPS